MVSSITIAVPPLLLMIQTLINYPSQGEILERFIVKATSIKY